jgi:hypothetical protein
MVENTLATVQTQRTELVEFISCLQVGSQPPSVTDARDMPFFGVMKAELITGQSCELIFSVTLIQAKVYTDLLASGELDPNDTAASNVGNGNGLAVMLKRTEQREDRRRLEELITFLHVFEKRCGHCDATWGDSSRCL